MKTKRYPTSVIPAVLVAAAIFAFPIAQPLLSAAQDDSPKPEQEQKYIAILQSEAPLFEKAGACRQLALIGTRKAVPALAGLLGDEILGDYARLALEPIYLESLEPTFTIFLSPFSIEEATSPKPG